MGSVLRWLSRRRMLLGILIFIALNHLLDGGPFNLVVSVEAQAVTYTQVTGTITDPNGLPYSGAIINVQLAPAPSGPANCGINTLQTNGQTTANALGFFQMALCPNASITPAGSRWQFNVSINPGVSPPFGFGPQACTPTLIVVAGASQDVSVTVSAACPALARTTGSTTGCTAAGAQFTVQASNGTGGCQATSITDSSVSSTVTIGDSGGLAIPNGGQVAMGEESPPTCAPGTDTIYASSVTHLLSLCNPPTNIGAILNGGPGFTPGDLLNAVSASTSQVQDSQIGGAGKVLTFPLRAAPPNPASGSDAVYADSTTGNLTCLTSVGANCFTPSGVTSVGLALPPEYFISNSPVTSIGTLTGGWNVEAPGTVLAGPAPNSIGGIYDGSTTNIGNSTTPTAGPLTPTVNHDWAFFVAQCPACTVPATMPGPWTVARQNGNFGSVFANILSTTTPLTATSTDNVSGQWSSMLFLLQYKPTFTPSVVQSSLQSGGTGDGTSVTFGSSTTPGNSILAVLTGAPASGGVVTFTDSQGNNFTPLGQTQNGTNSIVAAALSANLTGSTADVVTVHITNGLSVTNGGLFIFELTNIQAINPSAAVPNFQPLASLQASIPPIRSFTNKPLASSVAVTLNTLTTIDSVTVPMPPIGGPWRALVSYTYYKSGGVNYNCYVTDGTHLFAGFEAETTGNVPGCFKSEPSPVTYSNGQVVTFTTNIFDTGNSTITTTSNVHTPSAVSGIQVMLVPSSE